MNLFKGLLFLHGHITDPATLGEDFAPTYGNKAASARALRDRFGSPPDARPDDEEALCPAPGPG
jgi:hypothetical protein